MQMPSTLWEYRAGIELRTGPGRRLTGYAAVFNSTANIGGRFTEEIAPGAFAQTLAARNDVLALVDHDASKVLGRTKSGTLRLSEDVRGLAFDIQVPNTTLGADILEMAQRGDIGGASFSFKAIDEDWSGNHRSLKAVHLLEVSIVMAHPAYIDTQVYARSRDMSRMLERAKLRRLLVETL